MEEAAETKFGEEVFVEETRRGQFQVLANVAKSSLLIDEPVAAGGLGSGPSPYDLLSLALGSCTVMTLRLYADQKKWPLEKISAKVAHGRSPHKDSDIFWREICLAGPLDDTQRTRLLEIADRCPVHRTLHRNSEITMRLGGASLGTPRPPDTDDNHTTMMAVDGR